MSTRLRPRFAALIALCALVAPLSAPVRAADGITSTPVAQASQEAPSGAHSGARAVPAPTVDVEAAVAAWLQWLHELFTWLDRQHGYAMLDATPAEVEAYVRDRLATRYGYDQASIDAAVTIMWRESSMNPKAANPRSSARMLGQWLASTARSLGIDHPLTTGRWAPVDLQVEAFHRYVHQRYGGPRGALAFWNQRGWY